MFAFRFLTKKVKIHAKIENYAIFAKLKCLEDYAKIIAKAKFREKLKEVFVLTLFDSEKSKRIVEAQRRARLLQGWFRLSDVHFC